MISYSLGTATLTAIYELSKNLVRISEGVLDARLKVVL